MTSKARVVIVGAGFGGLNAARALGKAALQITVIDRKTFHTFQPLLYQVGHAGRDQPPRSGSRIPFYRSEAHAHPADRRRAQGSADVSRRSFAQRGGATPRTRSGSSDFSNGDPG